MPEAAGETTIYVSSYSLKKSGASLISSDTYLLDLLLLYCCFTAALLTGGKKRREPQLIGYLLA